MASQSLSKRTDHLDNQVQVPKHGNIDGLAQKVADEGGSLADPHPSNETVPIRAASGIEKPPHLTTIKATLSPDVDSDDDEFPPIEKLWATIQKNKQQLERLDRGSSTSLNNSTRYKEYVCESPGTEPKGMADTAQLGSKARRPRKSAQSKKRAPRRSKGAPARQGWRRSERIRARQARNDVNVHR